MLFEFGFMIKGRPYFSTFGESCLPRTQKSFVVTLVHQMAPILGHGLPSSPSTLDDNWVVMLFMMFISMLDTTCNSVDNLEHFICKQIIFALQREMVKPINLKINSWEVVKNGVLVDLMHKHL
jgi:hypothetical protein